MNKTVTIALILTAWLGGCTAPQGSSTSSSAVPSATGGIVPGSQEDLATNVGDRVFFDFDRSDLAGQSPAALKNAATLDRQAAWLTQYDRNKVQIAGNCDERGTEEYNLALGQRRADSVRGYLVAKGVAPGRITTISYGSERPSAVGSDEVAWSQNRNAITSLQ
ncbi:MAG TPA: OmpA family protein [Rhodopila sp.]